MSALLTLVTLVRWGIDCTCILLSMQSFSESNNGDEANTAQESSTSCARGSLEDRILPLISDHDSMLENYESWRLEVDSSGKLNEKLAAGHGVPPTIIFRVLLPRTFFGLIKKVQV